MLILMDQGWPWIIIGGLLIVWSLRLIGFSARDWVSFLVNLPFVYFSDDTQTEKEQAKTTLEEAAQAHPGCFLLILGVMATIVGVIKVIA